MVSVDIHHLEYDRYFEDTNYAVNGPNGIDKLNHLYRESMERQPRFDTIILDAKAAYQNFNIKEALKEILEHVPCMLKFSMPFTGEEHWCGWRWTTTPWKKFSLNSVDIKVAQRPLFLSSLFWYASTY
jgi:hypothetical protein